MTGKADVTPDIVGRLAQHCATGDSARRRRVGVSNTDVLVSEPRNLVLRVNNDQAGA